MATIDVMTVSEKGFKKFVTLSESETVSDMVTNLGFGIAEAERVLGQLEGDDVSGCKPKDLSPESCKELLKTIRKALRRREDGSIPKPNILARKVNEVDLDLLDA